MSDIVQRLPVIRKVRDGADFARLQEVAAEDEHRVYFPSHVVEKDGEVAGYLGVCSMPMLRVWLHKERMKARDTAFVMGVAENLLREKGVEVTGGLIARQSPLFPHLAKLGWLPVGESLLITKDLR